MGFSINYLETRLFLSQKLQATVYMGTGLGEQADLGEQVLTLGIRRGMILNLWMVKGGSQEGKEAIDRPSCPFQRRDLSS